MSALITAAPAGAARPARRGLLKRLSGLVAGSFLAGPLQALLGRGTPAAARPLTNQAYLGDILVVPFNFAPVNYLFCEGQLLSIAQYPALFALLGTRYGGNGTTEFALPDFQGRVPLGAGQTTGTSGRPGLNHPLGETGGVEDVALTLAQIPAHSHTLQLTVSTGLGTTSSPVSAFLARNSSGLAQYAATGTGYMPIGATGTAAPHTNLQPYLCLNFCICVVGTTPPRQ